jgi:DNA-binding MarR family transcriptional regulator
MPQASVRVAPSRDVVEGASERILTSLSTIARATNQVRLHERLLAAAGVRLDRAGATLLTKLALSDPEALRVTELAERLGVDTPTVTRKVQQLERLGFVVRTEDPADRRAHRIALTVSGRRSLKRLTVARREWLDGLLRGWSDPELEKFAVLLGRFTERLHEELEGGRGN